MTPLKPTCENCRMINWTDKNKNGYLCKLKRKRMHPTSMSFCSCELYNIQHTSWLSLLGSFQKVLHKTKKPFSLLIKKADSLYSNTLLKIEKRICKKKTENFTPGSPHTCYSCNLIDWDKANYNRHGFLCRIWNLRSHQKTYMNTHCCQYYNSKNVWLTKLVIKLRKKKKTVFKTNFHSVIALTKNFAEKNNQSIEDFKNNPDPVQYFSKEHLESYRKKRGVA